MRLAKLIVVAAASAALGAVPARAVQGSAVSTQPLAAGEVLLELTAVGTARQRADLATLILLVTCYAATEAEATRLMEQRLQQVRAAARDFGASEQDIRIQASPAVVDPLLVQAMRAGERPPGSEASAAAQQHAVRSAVEIRLREVGRLAAFQERLKGLGIADLGGPTYSLSDEREVRRRARDEAIVNLRADADAYAASLGMRVVRLVRVSERLADFFGLMTGAGPARRMEATITGASTSSDVEVLAIVSADFALASQ